MMLLSVWLGAARAACPATSEVVAFDADFAEAAFASLDPEALATAQAALQEDLGCLAEALAPPLVARVHGVFAMAAVVAKDDGAATAALVSARVADPTYTLPPAVPEGHRLRGMLDAAPAPAAGGDPVAAPTGTRSWVDGHEADVRPADRAAVLWLRDDAGRVPWSAFLPKGAPVPNLSGYAVLPPAPPPAPAPAPVADGRKVRLPLVVGTGAAAVGTGVLFGVAQSAASRFADPATPWADLDGLRSQANGLSAAGMVGLGATIGLGTLTLVAREVR